MRSILRDLEDVSSDEESGGPSTPRRSSTAITHGAMPESLRARQARLHPTQQRLARRKSDPVVDGSPMTLAQRLAAGARQVALKGQTVGMGRSLEDIRRSKNAYATGTVRIDRGGTKSIGRAATVVQAHQLEPKPVGKATSSGETIAADTVVEEEEEEDALSSDSGDDWYKYIARKQQARAAAVASETARSGKERRAPRVVASEDSDSAEESKEKVADEDGGISDKSSERDMKEHERRLRRSRSRGKQSPSSVSTTPKSGRNAVTYIKNLNTGELIPLDAVQDQVYSSLQATQRGTLKAAPTAGDSTPEPKRVSNSSTPLAGGLDSPKVMSAKAKKLKNKILANINKNRRRSVAS